MQDSNTPIRNTRRTTSAVTSGALALTTATIAFAAALCAPAASADDTEVFFTPVATGDKPNILFIIDSAQTMGLPVGTTIEWDSATDWEVEAKVHDSSFDCDDDKLYWTAGALPTTTLSDGETVTVNCSTMPYINVRLNSPDDSSNKFVCKTAMDALRSSSSVGYVTQSLIAQYDRTSSQQNNRQWRKMQGLNNNGSITYNNIQPDWVTECLADDGIHGLDSVDVNNTRPNNKTQDGFGTNASTANNSVYQNAKGVFTGSFTFYTANRIAFEVARANAPPSISTDTRLDAVKAALETMVIGVTGVRVGLMRFDNNAGASKGGMVVHELTDVATGGPDIIYTLNDETACNKNDDSDCVPIFTPADKKSIGETLWEAYRYYSNGPVDFGKQTHLKPTIPYPSVPASMSNPTAPQPNYASPMSECGKNYIVLLTDGLTEQDNSRDVTGVAALPNFSQTPEVANFGTSNAKCDVEDIKAGPTSSDCVDDLPAWMFRNDVSPQLAGVQNVKTFTVGFDLGTTGLGLAARSVLRDAARRGGGEYYDATNQETLEKVFDDIVRRILVDNASFTAPSVAVNAFNRTQNLNDIYMSVFKPALSYRWLGNVKKYKLTPQGEIVDASSPPKPAVDPSTGFFADGTKSYWTNTGIVDGSDATLGGAAGELASPATRIVYTNLKDDAGTLSVVDEGTLSVQLSALKGAGAETLAKQLLFNLGSADPAPTAPPINDLIDWAYGYDVQNLVGTSGTTTDPRLDMGDPLHARPATVIYGGPATSPDTIIFATTNDGYLHAIDADDGNELWAFAPVEVLPRLVDLYNDDGITERVYGLDGSMRAYKYDKDQDGVVESGDGDRVLLYFGMRRGGRHVYALDVTNRNVPKLLWRAGPADDPARGLGNITSSSSSYLPYLGQTWSTPTVARININRSWPTSNPDKLVVLFGGGYDPGHDTKTSYADDALGNGVYMLDAVTGDRIWSAGPTGVSASLALSDMKSAIASDVRSFDLTGDGFDDRMYASDLGGRVWRFDFLQGQSASATVQGGVFATLGVADTGGSPDNANRKFFYAPDPSLVRVDSRMWLNVAIGSGDRERPVSETSVRNRFYSLRDYNVFTPIPNNKYLADCTGQPAPCHQIITASDTRLTDVTTAISPVIPSSTVGWYMDLVTLGINSSGAMTTTWQGEKALAESRTFNNAVYFTTYTPRKRTTQDICGEPIGVSKLYVMSAVNAKPIFNFDVSVAGATTLSDRSKELAQGAIAPEVVFIFPTPDAVNGQPGPKVPPVCLVGLETCGGGVANNPVRTYWRQRGAD